ncbi:inhibitor of apoptosis-promoting Bax1-domain-containing protein [Helicostylum pulchrum]|uniref:Uncharacterized protein n=1 Tax=Helicostylum pulchrum TaxID=562976 RepID=A0ABP9YDZ8_9FUNG|nr:inhibitor of apoptosis-promoting Bax1-domain-containing protein [Helicostylum pulchrum]
MFKNTPQSQGYEQVPPPYEAEPSRSASPDNNVEELGHDMFKETVANSSVEIRMQFVRKVYSILTAQLLATAGVSALYMTNQTVKDYVQSSSTLFFISIFGSLGTLIALTIKGRSAPLNYYLLALFTLLESHLVGTIVTVYDKGIVIQALLITCGVFLALTLFTLQSKWDFSGMGPILLAGLLILLVSSILLPFSESNELPLAIGGIIIFSGYIIFDTYLIFNRYSPEDYIMAAISLYLDIINLFIRVLQIMNGNARR